MGSHHEYFIAIDSLTTEVEDLQLCHNSLCEFIHFFIFGLKKINWNSTRLELNSGITSHHPGHVPIKPSQ
jgi:hypothetical protein